MLRIRSIVFDILFYGWMLIFGVIMSPLAAVSRDGTYWVMKSFSRHSFFLLRVICGVRVEFRGTPPSPGEEVVVASKHQSLLDIMMLMEALPRGKYVMKKEIMWTPIFGFYAYRTGAVPVDRSKGREALEKMNDRLGDQRGEKGQIVIFPQGTRVPPGVKAPYKIGAAVLTSRFNLPCVPAATNVGLCWPKRGPKRPGVAVLEFLPERIQPEGTPSELLARIEAVVETASERLRLEGEIEQRRIADKLT
ncbi:lysophospholipid acyltransferase family protein [Neomegalonema perideroedes]|uniref:lysophospholipid acyltransferase family protein n=1 Tax=Neomegalonema perideroedes TaxID=217219 RepID=UPI000362A88A|nr:lysophospholipid acyltransferase family protein [Neomegalonema perideroedes]